MRLPRADKPALRVSRALDKPAALLLSMERNSCTFQVSCHLSGSPICDCSVTEQKKMPYVTRYLMAEASVYPEATYGTAGTGPV